MEVVKKIKYPKFLLIKIKKNQQFWTVWVFSPNHIVKKKIKVHALSIYQGSIIVSYDSRKVGNVNALHKTLTSNLDNIFLGLVQKYSKSLELFGVGFTVSKVGKNLVFNLGFSHKVVIKIPKFLCVTIEKKKLLIEGNNFNSVFQFAYYLKSLKPLDAYKGKGIKFEGEVPVLKESKKSK